MSYHRWGPALFALVWASGSVAQNIPDIEDLALAYGDRHFVSIATGSKQLLRQAPSVATVITSEDIEATGARSIDEILETVPGLHVILSSSGMRTYAIRGIASQYNPEVLMMLNGVPLTSVYLGNRGDIWGGMPLENVARIEVIRGPGSALYGADAFAGTINIVTKTAADIDGTQFGIRAGSYRSWDTWLSHGSQHGELEIAGYLRLGSTDGARRTIRADAQTALDNAGGTHASLAPGPMNDGYDAVDGQIDIAYRKFRWRASYQLRDNFQTVQGLANALDPQGRFKSERYLSDLSWQDPQFTRDWGLSLQFTTLQQANTTETPALLFPPGTQGLFPEGMLGAPSKWERQNRLSAAAVYSGWQNHRLRMGSGHDEMEIYKVRESKNFDVNGAPLGSLVDVSDTAPFMRPAKRYVNYIYLQDEWNFVRDWSLTAGLRHDNYSDFGSTTNPRLALVWDARQDLTVKAMYGTAFRAPSFADLYLINNPVATGNPELQPEKITTLEGAVAWQASRNLSLNLSVFQHQLTDIIRTVPNAVPSTGATFQNSGKQNGSGGEFEVNWDATPVLRLTGYYAYQKNTDETTGHDAGYAPHHHLYGRADWRLASFWQLDTQINYVADRNRPFGDNRPQVPDYTTVDLTLRTDRSKQGWDFSASIRNIFDADVREPSLFGSGIVYDLPMPRRNFWLQARYSL